MRVNFAEYIDIIIDDWDVNLTDPAALRAGLGSFDLVSTTLSCILTRWGARSRTGRSIRRQFDGAGYSLVMPTDLDAGTYDVVVYVWSLRTARWEAAQSVVVVVQ